MAKVTLDFTNAEDGFKLLPEGEYVCKVTKVEVKQGDKAKYFNWTLTVGLGEYKGQKVFLKTSLSVKALFKLREFMVACGIDVPKSKFNVDTDLIMGRVLGIVINHTTYKKDGQDKTGLDIAECYKVAKGATGWQRVGGSAPAEEEVTSEEEEVDLSDDTNVDDLNDDTIVPDDIEI